MSGHVFPSSFEKATSWLARSHSTKEEKNLMREELLKMAQDMLPRRIMIDFEKADLRNDVRWLEDHWKVYRNGMVFWALISIGVFEWDNFCKWLQKNSTNDDSAKKAIDLLRKHTTYSDT